MRVAIFSDVHGNLEALEAVLAACDDAGVSRLLCLGDTVGYGADPEACLDRVRGRVETMVAGNHDCAAAGLEDTRYFNTAARRAIEWTSTQLSAGSIAALRDCPLTAEASGALLVHASPEAPQDWHYLFSTWDGREALASTDAGLTFVGHSHVAFVSSESDAVRVTVEGEATLADDDRYLVNVGSVGQPRDNDPRAAFAVWDQDAATIRLCRVPYDIPTAQEKIRRAGLPAILSDRLAYGG